MNVASFLLSQSALGLFRSVLGATLLTAEIKSFLALRTYGCCSLHLSNPFYFLQHPCQSLSSLLPELTASVYFLLYWMSPTRVPPTLSMDFLCTCGHPGVCLRDSQGPSACCSPPVNHCSLTQGSLPPSSSPNPSQARPCWLFLGLPAPSF